jgi:hypothetical protein
MSESIHAPHPVKQPNLARKFPLTDMPTGRRHRKSSGHLTNGHEDMLATHIPVRQPPVTPSCECLAAKGRRSRSLATPSGLLGARTCKPDNRAATTMATCQPECELGETS